MKFTRVSKLDFELDFTANFFCNEFFIGGILEFSQISWVDIVAAVEDSVGEFCGHFEVLEPLLFYRLA